MSYHVHPKQLIMDAFLELLTQKPLIKISVPDICAKADIAKATFYRNFNDKYAIIAHIAALWFNVNLCSKNTPSTMSQRINVLIQMLTHLWDNRKALKNLFSYGKQNSVYDILFEKSVQYLRFCLKEEPSQILIDYCYGYAFARFGLLKKWLEEETFFADREHAILILNLCPPPLAAVYGLTNFPSAPEDANDDIETVPDIPI